MSPACESLRLPLRKVAFTTVELITVIAVCLILAGTLLPVVVLMGNRARMHRAQQTVEQLVLALETYRTLDPRRRYPLHVHPPAVSLYVAGPVPASTMSTQPMPLARSPFPDVATSPALFASGGERVGVLGMLVDMGLGPSDPVDADGCLVDPWSRRWNYQLIRPTAADPGITADWNWDPALGRARAWNPLDDCPAPFPFLWSYGKDGRVDDPAGWVRPR